MSWFSVFVKNVEKVVKNFLPVATQLMIGQTYDIPIDDYIVTVKITDIKKK